MEFCVPLDHWRSVTRKIADSLRDIRDFPPVISQYDDGSLVVRDGNHRIGAFQQLGFADCWSILWYPNESSYRHHERLGFEIAAV